MITPVYQIIRDGGDLTDTIKDKFISLSITDKIGPSADSLDLALGFDGTYARPRAGVVLEVKIGYAETETWDAGAFVVEETDLTGGANAADTLNIRALSIPVSPDSPVVALQGTTQRIWQSHEIDGTTFGDIVNEICRDAGLTAQIDRSLADIPMPTTVQTNQSDLEILIEISVLRDAFVKFHEGQCIIGKQDAGQIGSIPIKHGDVTSYRSNENDRYKIESVSSRYQDKEAGMVVKYETSDEKPQYEIFNTYSDRREAVDAAESLLKALRRQTEKAYIQMPTIKGLFAEKILDLSEFPDASLNGEFIVESVTTKLSSSGLTSNITAHKRQ